VTITPNSRKSDLHSDLHTVLVVEDAEPLRKMIASVLRSSGFTVIEAANGEEALAAFALDPDQIDLVLTDVIMPRMSGKELAERLSALSNNCPVVFMSGYVEDPVVEGVMNGSVNFVHKPFTAQTLLEVIRRNLDHHGTAGDLPAKTT
jgi:two-component system, cell cycle sensor histidine kinase and response regulator CckA